MRDFAGIEASLPGNEPDRARRADLLAAFLATLADGGVEHAVAVLDRPLADLEDTFVARLAELEALL